METRRRNRLVQAYYNPQLNSAAYFAKCAAGIALVGLIGVIGISSTDLQRDKLAREVSVNEQRVGAAGAPQGQGGGTGKQRQAAIEAGTDQHVVTR